MKSDTRPVISHPVPTTFTPNPLEYYDTSLEMTSAKKIGLRGWIKSRSRPFWVVVALSLFLIAGLAASLPVYFRTRHIPSLAVQSPEPSQNQTQPQNPGNTVLHSFLIDITTAEDEATRLAVNASKYPFNGRTE
jgi:hypothetical protein